MDNLRGGFLLLLLTHLSGCSGDQPAPGSETGAAGGEPSPPPASAGGSIQAGVGGSTGGAGGAANGGSPMNSGGTAGASGGASAGGAGGAGGAPTQPGPLKILSYSLIGEFRQVGWPVCDANGANCDYTPTKTGPGFEHKSIPLGEELLKRLATQHGFELTVYEGAARSNVTEQFTLEKLSAFGAIVFNNPNGMGLSATQREAFKSYINQGGGYVGIHAGINCENDWPWFHDFVGAFELGVVGVTEETLTVIPGVSTQHLSPTWTLMDEWHTHTRNVETQPNVTVLLRRAGAPVAWHREVDGGRMWYTGLGHALTTFSDPAFEQHVWEGIRWAARLP